MSVVVHARSSSPRGDWREWLHSTAASLPGFLPLVVRRFANAFPRDGVAIIIRLPSRPTPVTPER